MKTILHSALPGTVALLVMALSTRASLLTGTDPAFGANSLTIDTQTQLAWLNLSYTADLSYNQVLTDMQPGGMFSNYTFATSQEVVGLYADAGIGVLGYNSLSSPAISSLISLVGSTGPINGYPGFIAISGTSNGPGAQAAPAITAVGINGNEEYFVSGGPGSGSTSYGDSTSYPTVADWLVTTVPEPCVGSIAIAGIAVLTLAPRLKSRRIFTD